MPEEDGTLRYGQTYMDNVEIYNCSQIDTSKAALRWESNAAGNSSITNSVVHGSLSWFVNMLASANVVLKNNVMFGARAIGINIQSSKNVTIDGNILGNVQARPTLSTADMAVDKEAGMTICSYNEPDSCTDISVINNIVGGVQYAGFLMFGHDCGQSATQQVFRNNVAHSVAGVISGHGALVNGAGSNLATHSTCFEASYFAAYKCTLTGIGAYFTTKKIIFSHMTMIDNRLGMTS